MGELLRQIGTNPYVLGIAAIGGIIGLIYLVATISVNLWTRRDDVRTLTILLKRRILRKRVKWIWNEYYFARRWSEDGLSDRAVGALWMRWHLVDKSLLFFLSALVFLQMYVLLLSTEGLEFGEFPQGPATSVLSALIVLGFLMSGLLVIVCVIRIFRLYWRVVDIMIYAGAPEVGFRLAKDKMKNIRSC